jgi:hypothetical protein
MQDPVRNPYIVLLSIFYLIAGLLHFYTIYQHLEMLSLSFPFIFYLFILPFTPYLLSAVLYRQSSRLGATLGAGLSLALDSVAYYETFMAPQNSTAALSLLTTPVVNILIVLIAVLIVKSTSGVYARLRG